MKIELKTIEEIAESLTEGLNKERKIVDLISDLIKSVEKYNLLGMSKKRIVIEGVRILSSKYQIQIPEYIEKNLDDLIETLVNLLNTHIKTRRFC